jgi:hypothetical protein
MSKEPLTSPTFAEVLSLRLDRRRFLRAGMTAAGAAALAPVLGSCTSSPSEATGARRPGSRGARPLGFSAIEPRIDDGVFVPDGYSANVLISWGDPLRRGMPPFDPDTMTAADQEQRFGYNCDFVAFLPLPDALVLPIAASCG